MIPKVKLVFDRKSKAVKNEEGDVEVYIYHMGAKRYLATGVRCRKREYRDGVVSMRADAVELNKRLQWCVRTVQEQINKMVDDDCVNMDRFTLSVTDRNSDFLEWVRDEVAKQDVKPKTQRLLLNFIGLLRGHNVFKTFADVTLQDVEKFDMAIRGLKPSTRRNYHGMVKQFIKMGIKADLIVKNPYDRFTMPKDNRAGMIKYLTNDELREIENVSVTGKMNFTKDLFLFGCYTGLRWSDIQQLSKSNYERREGNDWLIGVQQKTGNNYAIVLLPEAKQILDKWEWNMCRIGIATMNINLKRLACLAGIGRLLTMHMSRHTFATLAMSKGVRMEIVSKMLGHSDVKMTQIYAKVLQRDVEEGFALLASRM